MKLTPEEKRKVVSCCNGNLIPDHDFDWVHNYPREWYQQKFDFYTRRKAERTFRG